ncbi:TetR/AcrR family transcriptional regulator [Actinophytocola sp.]|jgi:AcrR family transcriptional regulator|uniref:TetR/AcrR family transcriptional regulator n=1 Tax=Actinophytocola sp. TaxID=1872138 RepID=UPI002EDA14E5
MTTKERLAAAARGILLAEGADAVNMRRVAKDAGLSTMATYRHYPNRETLLREVADACSTELAKDWGRRSEITDPLERLFALQEDLLDFALGAPHLYTFLMTDRREDARRFPGAYRDGASPTYGLVVIAVEEAMRAGLLREGDPLEVTLAFTAQAQGLVQLYLGGRIGLPEPEFRALCARSLGRVLDGIKA